MEGQWTGDRTMRKTKLAASFLVRCAVGSPPHANTQTHLPSFLLCLLACFVRVCFCLPGSKIFWWWLLLVFAGIRCILSLHSDVRLCKHTMYYTCTGVGLLATLQRWVRRRGTRPVRGRPSPLWSLARLRRSTSTRSSARDGPTGHGKR